jgi:starch-binding outer membrane protein, SusD/RagB family
MNMQRSRVSNRVVAAAGVLFGALGVVGCGLLDTENPNIVDAGTLDNPAGAATKRLGAISQFTLAKDGDYNFVEIPGTGGLTNDASDGQILLSGVLSDELVNPGFIPTRTEIDLRQGQPTNVTIADLYRSLHRARAAAEDAAISLATFSPDPAADTGIPEMLALAGLTYVYFAEDFCSGVPVSRTVGGVIEYGDQLTTQQMLDTAVARFQLALTHPSIAAGDPIHSLASVGLGRALLNLGDFAGAAAAVQSVLPEFVYLTEHAESPSALQNTISLAFSGGNFGVDDQEGGEGLDYVSAEDLRVTGDSGTGTDGATLTWIPSKYPTLESPVPTADYLEAQLIIAESELRAGNFGGALTILNTLRTDAGLPGDLTDPGTADAQVDLLFRERAFWLFLTGHRLGDLRRLIRQYGRTADTVFPSGTYFKGGQPYGAAVNLPLPATETNNPKVTGCLDREA